jgi:hypothetical protein
VSAPLAEGLARQPRPSLQRTECLDAFRSGHQVSGPLKLLIEVTQLRDDLIDHRGTNRQIVNRRTHPPLQAFDRASEPRTARRRRAMIVLATGLNVIVFRDPLTQVSGGEKRATGIGTIRNRSRLVHPDRGPYGLCDAPSLARSVLLQGPPG